MEAQMKIHPGKLQELIKRQLAFVEGRRIFMKCEDCGKFV
jgi:hypothetical protein